MGEGGLKINKKNFISQQTGRFYDHYVTTKMLGQGTGLSLRV